MFDTSTTGTVEDIFADGAGNAEKTHSTIPSSPPSRGDSQHIESTPPTPPAGPSPMLEAGTKTGKRIILASALILLIAGAVGGAYWYFRVSKVQRPSSDTLPMPELSGSEQSLQVGKSPDVMPENVVPVSDTSPKPENTVDVSAPDTTVPEQSVSTLDTDRDGLTDGEEVALGSDINRVDSDFDGLFDYEEVKTHLTDPTNADTDGDTFSDGIEVKNGFNPRGPGRLQTIPSL